MAWTTPYNFSAQEVLTAVHMNAINANISFLAVNISTSGTLNELLLAQTKKIYFDSDSNKHTYIYEQADNVLHFVCGGTLEVEINTSGIVSKGGVFIEPTNKLFFDANEDGDTYITETADGVLDFYADAGHILRLGESARRAELPAFDNGSGATGPQLVVGWNNHSTPGAGSLLLYEKSGTAAHYHTGEDGKLYSNTVAPTNANDQSGTVVGDQTSWHTTKREIRPFDDCDALLERACETDLYTFKMKRDGRYGERVLTGLVGTSREDWFLAHTQEGCTPVLSEMEIYGVLIGSIKALTARVRELEGFREIASRILFHTFKSFPGEDEL